MGVAGIFPWGGPKYRFQNFGKFGRVPTPPPLGRDIGGGVGISEIS